MSNKVPEAAVLHSEGHKLRITTPKFCLNPDFPVGVWQAGWDLV